MYVSLLSVSAVFVAPAGSIASMSVKEKYKSDYLRPVDVARELGKHPSVVNRWMTKGTKLSSGERLRLEAVRTPGGWLTRREWLDAYLKALTEDYRREDTTVPATRPTASRRISELESRLTAAGF